MSKARDLANAGTALGAVSPTELAALDGVTSAVQPQIDAKLATATAASTYEPALPSQIGNADKFLKTDGTNKSWTAVSQYALPSQTGNAGKFLTTNGTSESWATATVDKTTAPWVRAITAGRQYSTSIYAMNIDSNNKVFVAGKGYSVSASPLAISARFSQDGTVENIKTLTRSNYTYDVNAAYVDTSGNMYLSGNYMNGSTSYGGGMLKTNLDGTIQWHNWILASTNKYCVATYVDSSGNVYDVGKNTNGTSQYQAYVTKRNSSGVSQFAFYSISPGNYYTTNYFGVTTDSSGNVYAVGDLQSTATSETDILVTKLDSTGVPVWRYQYRLNQTAGVNEKGWDATTDSSGNIYVTGASGTNTFLMKLDSSGNIVWQRYIARNSDLNKIALDSSNGDIYIVGSHNSYYPTSQGIVIKYNSSGTLQWSRYLTGGFTTEYLYSIIVPSGNYFYISGSLASASASNVGVVAKLYKDGSGLGTYETGFSPIQYMNTGLTDAAYSLTKVTNADGYSKTNPAEVAMTDVASNQAILGISTGYLS